MIDINDFKLINDEFGYEERVGNCLLSLARDQDLVFRIGGDEFCLVVLAQSNINQLIEQRIIYNFVSSGINASVGMVFPRQLTTVIFWKPSARQM